MVSLFDLIFRCIINQPTLSIVIYIYMYACNVRTPKNIWAVGFEHGGIQESETADSHVVMVDRLSILTSSSAPQSETGNLRESTPLTKTILQF